MKKKILVLVLSDLRHDARVRRQVDALKTNYDVTVVAFDGSDNDGYRLIRLPSNRLSFTQKALSSFFLLAGLNSIAFRILHDHSSFIQEEVGDSIFDLVIANDVETLPLAFSFDYKPKVLFDAHEYAPRHFEDKRWWRVFFQRFNIWLCKKYLPKVSAMTTVGMGLAKEYEKNFGIRPLVITNASPYFNIQPGQVEKGKIRLVHHGIVNPSRSLHLMIDMMQHLDHRFTLDIFLLVPPFASARSKNYLSELKLKAAADQRIKIFPPIPGAELVQKLKEYDVGIFLLPPVNFNYENTLPNKLFDFIQARLAVAIGPTPEMAEILREFSNGVVSNDFSAKSLGEKLQRLTEDDVMKMKINSSRAAMIHNAENNSKLLNELVATTIS